MNDQIQSHPSETVKNQPATPADPPTRSGIIAIRTPLFWIPLLLLTYLAGLGSGWRLWHMQPREKEITGEEAAADPQESAANEPDPIWAAVNPPDGYAIPAHYTQKLGPQLIEKGVIDLDRFANIYVRAGLALSADQLKILTEGSDARIVISAKNQYFLLNLFWAVGLASKNPILDEGSIQKYGSDGVMGFASTAGWTLASRPVEEIFSSIPLFEINAEQQTRLEEAAGLIYRPCCDNPTNFPDCNHGMAMLGLLELMSSQDASVNEMLEAAKYVNAFWYPQQAYEQALLLTKAFEPPTTFAEADARELLGARFSSGSGFQAVHAYLAQNGFLEQAPGNNSSCGV